MGLVCLHHLEGAMYRGIPAGLDKMARLAAGTLIWYWGARIIFPIIEEATGGCTTSQFLTKKSCYRAGFMWTGFDTSGHCFLLTFNNLFIMEETNDYEESKKKERILQVIRLISIRRRRRKRLS